jgi:dolichol kinase
VPGGWPQQLIGVAAVAGWLTLLAITAVAVLLEQVAVGGLDNFTVPLAAGWLWQRLS